ncbi:ChaN family lipoprotein [Ideonella livida]|uniref:ChaN family lipoprotein n=1 Tax=Ideonella livida TaxID=2707176 RepID=A0A7C9PFQ5_9BURK|nr:ChaN family lipoprotein [Ideonella livida]NDY90270.1 ChaN family lipoprotein [Ideonella livida]
MGSRRHALIRAGLSWGTWALASGGLGACAWMGPQGGSPSGHSGGHPPEGQGYEAATGRPLDPTAWQARLAQADVLLLGERHDNALHHTLRGRWIAALPHAQVVAEHLPQGGTVVWPTAPNLPEQQEAPSGPREAAWLAALTAAGFEPQAWGWPLHQGLMAPLAQAGVPVRGGNLPRALARRIAREGEAALPPALAASLARAPLSGGALASLQAALVQGHCGQLPVARLPAMVAAQRARDAAMGQSLLAAWDAGARPAVLVAGNGHVRTDWGVPVWLRAQRPGLRVLSVVMSEVGEGESNHPLPGTLPPQAPGSEGAAADLLWLAPAPAGREDPCQGLNLPR